MVVMIYKKSRTLSFNNGALRTMTLKGSKVREEKEPPPPFSWGSYPKFHSIFANWIHSQIVVTHRKRFSKTFIFLGKIRYKSSTLCHFTFKEKKRGRLLDWTTFPADLNSLTNARNVAMYQAAQKVGHLSPIETGRYWSWSGQAHAVTSIVWAKHKSFMNHDVFHEPITF